ncbi:MAG: hypothetical protein LBB23_01660 [Rickettsiales bacterium]|jgi:hypothetical protein|nr:hypothetical protein [Rickettsiales bacterium]
MNIQNQFSLLSFVIPAQAGIGLKIAGVARKKFPPKGGGVDGVAGRGGSNNKERGSSLLELLMLIAIFMSLLPFIYRQAASRETLRLAAEQTAHLATARDALTEYIEANESRLANFTGAAVYQVRTGELAQFGYTDDKSHPIRARVMKARDAGGRSYLQGVIIAETRGQTPLMTRQVALAGGERAGFVSGERVYGAFGTWEQPLKIWNAKIKGEGLVLGTPVVQKRGDYLARVPTGRTIDSTMLSDLNLDSHDLKNVGALKTNAAQAAEEMALEWGHSESLSFAENVQFEGAFGVSGEANVLGDLTSESADINVHETLMLGNAAKFRSVEMARLTAMNLTLEWVAAGDARGQMTIARHLGMSNGGVSGEIMNVGPAGVVATSVSVSEGVQDSADESYYWNFNEREAILSDIQLVELNTLMRKIIVSESATGTKTEMEKTMQPVASNANSTLTDYLRALSTAITKVETKFNSLGLK